MHGLLRNGLIGKKRVDGRQAYAFMNGVLNTDNTSIVGLSMDFGPFAVRSRESKLMLVHGYL